MKKLISFNQAAKISLILFGLFILFHAAILIGIVMFDYAPLDFLWGGRMETKEELLHFEIISLMVMMLCFIVVSIRSRLMRIPKLVGISKIVLWVMFAMFVVNTIGNILAKSTFEKFFAVFTIALAFLCLRLALEKT